MLSCLVFIQSSGFHEEPMGKRHMQLHIQGILSQIFIMSPWSTAPFCYLWVLAEMWRALTGGLLSFHLLTHDLFCPIALFPWSIPQLLSSPSCKKHISNLSTWSFDQFPHRTAYSFSLDLLQHLTTFLCTPTSLSFFISSIWVHIPLHHSPLLKLTHVIGSFMPLHWSCSLSLECSSHCSATCIPPGLSFWTFLWCSRLNQGPFLGASIAPVTSPPTALATLYANCCLHACFF